MSYFRTALGTNAARLRALLLGCVCVIAAWPRSARSDWPMQRHDVARTGAASGTSNINEPAAYFRYYLGGALFGSHMLTFDVDGAGGPDILMLTGGRVVARTVGDRDLWSSPPRGLTSMPGLADLDGDGSLELVVVASAQVFVLDPRTGAELWREPPGEMGTVGGVRMADFDADGSTDLLIAECGCCGVNSGYPGAIYSFSSGFASARRIFELPSVHCGFSRAITVIEIDGVAPPELVLPEPDRLRVWSPATATMIAESPALGSYSFWNRCWPGQLDADPGEELACVMMESDSDVVDRWRVAVLDRSAGTLAVRWSQVLAPDATGEVRALDPLADLDGDGTLELTLSVAVSGAWETRIFDAASGALHTTLPGAIAVGRLEGQLVTRSASTLSAFEFASGSVTPAWTLDGVEPFTAWSYERAARLARPEVLFTIDLDSDGRDELLATAQNGTRLSAYRIQGSTATEIASQPIPAGTRAQAAWQVPPLTSSNGVLAVSYSDGIMVLYDALLRPALAGGEFDPARLRTGGYYAAGAWRDLRLAPVTGAFEAGAPEAIVVPDARGALLRLDASQASWASPPEARWERLYTTAPTIVDGLIGGSRAVACLSARDPLASARQDDVVVLRPDGMEQWRAPAPDAPLLDLVPARLDADSVPDLVFHWGDPSTTRLRTRAVSGADGATLWEGPSLETGSGRQPAGLAIGRFDADDRDDVYFQGGSTRVLSGTNGSELAALGGPSYFMPTLVDLDGDPGREVVLHGGFDPLRVADHDLSRLTWTSSEDDRPYPYAAIAQCPDGVVLASGSWQLPARMKLTRLNGPTAGVETPVFLASGARYGSRAELDAAGAFAGQLTSVAVHADLAGDGRPAALVGSTDGWLYWIAPCDGSLVHAIELGVAVGQPVFGDTDGDGLDEILVSAADGYLYGIEQRYAASPAFVNDIDPADPTSTDDADYITTEGTFIARWGAVPGALRYEVGLFDEAGRPVLSPRWRDMGTQTEVTLEGVALEIGRRYYAGVRAYSAQGPSVDAVSDGAFVRSPAAMIDAGMDAGADAGPGPRPSSGCGCRVGPRDHGAHLWLVLALAVWSGRRRGRARRASVVPGRA